MKTAVAMPKLQGILARMRRGVIAIFMGFMIWPDPAAAQSAPLLLHTTVAEGVHVLRASSPGVTPENQGFVTNIGVIEDERGLIVIGTGTSRSFAIHLITHVERVFGKPVIAAVNLYGGGDHVLGNGVFVSRGVPVTAHFETDRFIRSSCHTCVERLTAVLGENMMAGTEPTPATVVFDQSELLAGVARKLKLLHFGHTFQPGATALLDEASGTLFVGELAAVGYVPDLYNAGEVGWRDALEQLAGLGARVVVPSHGAPGGLEMLDASRRYLDALISRVAELFSGGSSLQEALDQVDFVEFRSWHGYAAWHRRNVHLAYLHREQLEFGRSPRP
jgi:cyclase